MPHIVEQQGRTLVGRACRRREPLDRQPLGVPRPQRPGGQNAEHARLRIGVGQFAGPPCGILRRAAALLVQVDIAQRHVADRMAGQARNRGREAMIDTTRIDLAYLDMADRADP